MYTILFCILLLGNPDQILQDATIVIETPEEEANLILAASEFYRDTRIRRLNDLLRGANRLGKLLLPGPRGSQEWLQYRKLTDSLEQQLREARATGVTGVPVLQQRRSGDTQIRAGRIPTKSSRGTREAWLATEDNSPEVLALLGNKVTFLEVPVATPAERYASKTERMIYFSEEPLDDIKNARPIPMQEVYVISAEPVIEGYYTIRRVSPEGLKLVAGISEEKGFRTWSTPDGKFTVEARFRGTIADQVNLERKDGTRITLSLDRLSPKDQQFIEEFRRKR